jgi:hypothetical protein
LNFEKLKRWTIEEQKGRPCAFLIRLFFELPTHLAHAIAAQTQRDTKAMARAKSLPPLAALEKSYIRYHVFNF